MKMQNVSQEEARLSMLLGGGLLFLGFKTTSIFNLLILATGGYLAYRGATKRCMIKKLIEETSGQQLSRGSSGEEPAQESAFDEVDEASWESFPASDAPSFTPNTR